MAKGKTKGANYERELCKQFSLWWTKGERNDVFWRTAGSGAMATNRSFAGKSAKGQYGDVTAVDPIGAPLIELCTIEAKRGHKEVHLGDVLDRRPSKPRQWEVFVHQAQYESALAGVPFWLLIVRRDRREALIFFPWGLYKSLLEFNRKLRRVRPWVKFQPEEHPDAPEIGPVFCTKLDHFFKRVDPSTIKDVLNDLRRQ